MGLLELFFTASVPVLNVLLLTAVGSISATSRVGILSPEARKHLNNVVYYVFNPALVSSSLSQTITLKSMVLLWFLPVNLILNFVIGSALGWAVIRITKAPAQIQGVILATCSAGNVGNLLLILVPAMCKEKGSPLGSSDVCDTFGLTYASLSLAIGTILQWSYVYNIVRIYSSPKEEKVSNHQPTLEFQRETQRLLPQSCTPKIASTSDQLNPHLSSKPCTPRLKSEENNATKKVLLSMLDKTKVLLGKVSRVIDLKKSFAPSSVGVVKLASAVRLFYHSY